jgi:exodeoxyribonuclease-3
MRVISFNANGIRAAARKGFFDWLPRQGAGVVCIQETKAQVDQLSDPVFHPDGYHCFYCDAEKKGYAGTALYVRREPDEVTKELGFDEFDRECRWCEARFGDLVIASLYIPSGASSEERLAAKMRFHELFRPHLQELRDSGRRVIICGDWNTAHKEIDLRNWRSNRKNSGFLPEERAWLDRVFDEIGMIDAFRVVHPDTPDLYTWWSNRGRAWEKNVGWRIDYQIITPDLRKKIRDAWIYTDERFSDHAPLVMDYELTL